MYNETIEERMQTLESGELWLAIEGRFTNLRIWTGCDKNGKHPRSEHDTVFMRLDKANAFSAPLDNDTFTCLQKEHPAVKQLLQFGFKSSIDNLPKIMEITKDMKWRRDVVEW